MSIQIKQDNMICPECGATINIQNHYRCSRFPICTYSIPKDMNFKVNEDSYIIFDFETTGLDKRKDRIIEIGAIKIINGTPTDKFSLLLNPGKTQTGTQIYISSEITRITNITNQDLEGQPTESEGLLQFFNWASDIDTLVGHNIDRFDIPFMKAACRRAQVGFPFSYSIDSLKFVKSLELKRKGFIVNEKQTTLAEYVGFSYNAHRALDDVEALYKILKELSKLGDPVVVPIGR